MAASRKAMMCLFTFLALMFIFNNSPVPAEANIIKDVIETIEDVTCPLKHQDEANVCRAIFSPLYFMQASLEEDFQKGSCCNRLLAHNCMDIVVKTYCGDVARFAATIATSLDKFAAKDKCGSYESLEQCTNPALAFLIIASYLIVAISIIGCVCMMCCCHSSPSPPPRTSAGVSFGMTPLRTSDRYI